MLENNPLSDMFCKYFIQLCISLFDSGFWYTKYFNSDKVWFTPFLFCFLGFWCYIQEIIAKIQYVKIFSHAFFSKFWLWISYLWSIWIYFVGFDRHNNLTFKIFKLIVRQAQYTQEKERDYAGSLPKDLRQYMLSQAKAHSQELSPGPNVGERDPTSWALLTAF